MTDNNLPVTAQMDEKPKGLDPFPTLSYAMRHRWGILDHWAWRRLERLSVPAPWIAFHMGIKHAEARMKRGLPPVTDQSGDSNG